MVEPSAPRTEEQDALAACLACGAGSVVSHRTAARLLGLDVPSPAEPQITMAAHRSRQPDGVRVHRSRRLGRSDVATVRGISITSPARLLLDLAATEDDRLVELVFDALWRRGSIRPERVAAYVDLSTNRSRRGAGIVRALAAERIGTRPPGSDLETLYFRLLRRYGLPLPVRQYPIETRRGPKRVDYAYPPQKVVVELDGIERHGRDRVVFDDDRIRQNELLALGWSVRRFTWAHVTSDELLVVVTTAEALNLVPARWRHPKKPGPAGRSRLGLG